jgi:hypothetical protein
MNMLITRKGGDKFIVTPPPAIQKTRNKEDNACCWAREVFKNVTLVQFTHDEPKGLPCCIDIDGLAIVPWEFMVYVPWASKDMKLDNDENIEKVERWLDNRIYNMLSWTERN